MLERMSTDPREALNRLIAALEHHYDVAQNSEVIQEAALEGAEDLLRDAFFTYDDILFTSYGVEMPFEMLDDDDDDDEYEEYEDEDGDDVLFEGEDEEHDD